MPRLAFINKLDRAGADPWRVCTSAHIILLLTVWLQGLFPLKLCMTSSGTPCAFDNWFRFLWYVDSLHGGLRVNMLCRL